jgi:hypothetical protein
VSDLALPLHHVAAVELLQLQFHLHRGIFAAVASLNRGIQTLNLSRCRFHILTRNSKFVQLALQCGHLRLVAAQCCIKLCLTRCSFRAGS